MDSTGMSEDQPAVAFQEFVHVIKALRTPETGCPWDLKQNHLTLRRYLIEESHEVLDAIERGDDTDLCDELGDLLLQVVLHAQVAADRQAFTITEVIKAITAKMVRRHPHVFGDAKVSGSEEVLQNWEQIKRQEREARPKKETTNPLAAIPASLPALLRAQRVGEKAEKLLGKGSTADADQEMEEFALGEYLFALCQDARRAGLNAEDCLRAATRRFIESQAAALGEPPPPSAS